MRQARGWHRLTDRSSPLLPNQRSDGAQSSKGTPWVARQKNPPLPHRAGFSEINGIMGFALIRNFNKLAQKTDLPVVMLR